MKLQMPLKTLLSFLSYSVYLRIHTYCIGINIIKLANLKVSTSAEWMKVEFKYI